MKKASGLRRFVEPAAPALPFPLSGKAPQGEVCEMCGVPIPDEHPHVVHVEHRNLLCACRPCYLLFTHEGAGGGGYRAVPERYLTDPEFRLTDAQWSDLQIPVSTAFFFRNSLLGTVIAQYPSPAGATESLLDLAAWDQITAENPLAAAVEPDVEALLVHSPEHGTRECYLVPIDVCYELVGRLRLLWSGFDGGAEAKADIAAFFETLAARSRIMRSGART